MKALQDPTRKTYGMSYTPYFTDEFQSLIDKAKDKIEPYGHREISGHTVYFKVRGEDVSSEYDTCDDEKCIKEAKKAIRKSYGKGTRVEECWYGNDGPHESIEVCCRCGKALNEFLDWCKDELEYLERHEWTAEFLQKEGFLIYSILYDSPSMDEDISDYEKHQGGDILREALEHRERFFQRVGKLAQCILDTDFGTRKKHGS